MESLQLIAEPYSEIIVCVTVNNIINNTPTPMSPALLIRFNFDNEYNKSAAMGILRIMALAKPRRILTVFSIDVDASAGSR